MYTEEQLLKKARLQAVFFALVALFAVLAFLYGLTQRMAKEKSEERYVKQHQEDVKKLEVALADLEACSKNK